MPKSFPSQGRRHCRWCVSTAESAVGHDICRGLPHATVLTVTELQSNDLSNSTGLGSITMQSTITARGQTVVPAAIRNQLHLGPSDRLEWILDNGSIRVVPVRSNPIDAFRGQGQGGATARLLAARKQDSARE